MTNQRKGEGAVAQEVQHLQGYQPLRFRISLIDSNTNNIVTQPNATITLFGKYLLTSLLGWIIDPRTGKID